MKKAYNDRWELFHRLEISKSMSQAEFQKNEIFLKKQSPLDLLIWWCSITWYTWFDLKMPVSMGKWVKNGSKMGQNWIHTRKSAQKPKYDLLLYKRP